MNFHFSNPVIFHRITAIQVLEKADFLEKNIKLLFLFSKNNRFWKKSLIETESRFKRAIALYFFYFEIWRMTSPDMI